MSPAEALEYVGRNGMTVSAGLAPRPSKAAKGESWVSWCVSRRPVGTARGVGWTLAEAVLDLLRQEGAAAPATAAQAGEDDALL